MNASAIAIAATLIEDINKNSYPLQFVGIERLERVLECIRNNFSTYTIHNEIIYDYSDGMDLHVKMTLWCLNNPDFVMRYNFAEGMSYGTIANKLIENEVMRRIG